MTTARDPAERIYFFERPPWSRRWVCVALGAIFAALDFVTGPFIQFPIFFVLPVMLLAATSDLAWGASLAIVLCLVRFSFHFFWAAPWTMGVAILNAAMDGTVLLILAAVAARMSHQTKALRSRVQTLEGILPICGFCKDIRNESGEWEKMEAYVSLHSQAQFSHGLCPKCAQKYYGDFYKPK